MAMNNNGKLSLEHRLIANSMPVTESGCLIWLGCTQNAGYGVLSNKKRGLNLVHRVAWEIAYGPVPDGKFVCHRCDVRCCINREHLFLGTNVDNMRDAASKGRMGKSLNVRMKLSIAMKGNTNMLGHRHSPATIEKMRRSALLREARMRVCNGTI